MKENAVLNVVYGFFSTKLEIIPVYELLRPLDVRWVDFLKRVGKFDSYHEPAYASLCGQYEGGEGFALWGKDEKGYEILLPLLFKRFPVPLSSGKMDEAKELWDASSPYGFPGPLIINPDGASAEECMEAWRNFQSGSRDFLRERGVVSLFVRLHPILNPLSSFPVVYGSLSEPAQTVYVDLASSLEDIHSKMAKSHRAGVRKLIRMGFTAIVNDFSLLHDFVCLYHKTMARLEASENYYFSVGYFESLMQAFGDRFSLIMIRSPDGEIVAGGLFLEAGDFVQFHLSAAAEEYRSVAPGKLVSVTGFEFFKSRGRKIFHFGGGVGGRMDSLFIYKSRFSPLRGNFQVWKVVINEEVYFNCAGTSPESDPAFYEGFFPHYRRESPNES